MAGSITPGWNTSNAVAVVTGAAKGIGYHIARALSNDHSMHVVMTSRDPASATSAANAVGSNAVGYGLDVSDSESSVPEFRDWLSERYGGIDCLVANASIAFHRDAFSGPEAEQTMRTNVHGTVALVESLKGMMPREDGGDGRVVVVSSASGEMALQSTGGAALQRMRTASTANDITDIASEFASSVADGSYKDKGYSASMYGTSKLLETLYAQVLQRDFEQRGKHNIIVTSAHPGELCSSRVLVRSVSTLNVKMSASSTRRVVSNNDESTGKKDV